MREEQRGSLPEPCPAGSRARPPWLPPAPPALGELPAGGGAVPGSVRELYRAFHGTLCDTGALRAYGLRKDQLSPVAGACGTDPVFLAETRECLLARIEEFRARLLLGDNDLSEPLLRIFQNQVLGLVLSNAPLERITDASRRALADQIIRRALGLMDPVDPEWLQFPFPVNQPIMRFDRQPAREFARGLLDETERAVRDPGSYETLERFDGEISRRSTAVFAGAVAVVDWVRANMGASGAGSV